MQRTSLLLLLFSFLMACHSNKVTTMESSSASSALTDEEKREGWQLLFDGKTTAGWHRYGNKPVGKGWKIQDGALFLDASVKDGGDLVTDQEFDNFHLKLEWKISPKGNSGIMFYVKEDPKYTEPYWTGPEMQVLDNSGHSDAQIVKHRTGDLYDLITAKEAAKPVGEWNLAEIVANKGKLDFYLNGVHTLSTTLWDDNWRQMIAASKFKDAPDFGKFQSGKIALQDHGDNVWYRNIKIKKL